MGTFRDVSTVVSIMPIPIREIKPGLIPAEYRIAPVKNCMTDVSVLVVERATFPVYIDENRPSLVVPEPSDRVAEAICRDYKVGLAPLIPKQAEPGLFWVKGAFTGQAILAAWELGEYGKTRDELQLSIHKDLTDQRKWQMEWFKLLVEEADDNWGRFHMRRVISTLHKEAARALKLEREWSIDAQITQSMSRCKFCLSQVEPEAIVCPNCTGVLNMERYSKEFVRADMGQK